LFGSFGIETVWLTFSKAYGICDLSNDFKVEGLVGLNGFSSLTNKLDYNYSLLTKILFFVVNTSSSFSCVLKVYSSYSKLLYSYA